MCYDVNAEFVGDHSAIVSYNDTEVQCMDCLRKWPKLSGFKSDWPQYDNVGDTNG